MESFFKNKIVKTVEILIILAVVWYFAHNDITGFFNSFKYGHFINIPNMNIARAGHTATIMKDGRVLIAGGSPVVDKKALRTAEIYDPEQNKFILVPNKSKIDLVGSKSFLLGNGKVIILDHNGIETFDPKTNTFELVNQMLTPRYFFEAMKLKDDKVLICGGFEDKGLHKDIRRNCEIYDSIKNNSYLVNNKGKTLTPFSWKESPLLLQNGKAIFIHKYSNLIYNPIKNKFTKQVIPAINNNYIGSAITLNNKKVLVVPEFGYSYIFDPYTNKVYQTLNERRRWGRSFGPETGGIFKTFLLNNGKVLIINNCWINAYFFSYTPAKADLYDPDTDNFIPLGKMNRGRYEYTATLLKNGTVLITGGIKVGGLHPDFGSATAKSHIEYSVSKTAEIFIPGE